MKKVAFTLAVLALLLSGNVKRSGALAEPQAKNIIVVELRYARAQMARTFRVPIVENPSDRKPLDGRVEGGCWAFTGSCDKNLGCEYCMYFIADGAGEDKYKVVASLTFEGRGREKCDTHREFMVIRGKSTEFKAKCGIVLKAFYE